METAINFYELKTQLAGLGFVESAVVDQLRQAMTSDFQYASLYTERDQLHIQINLDKNYMGDFQFENYDAILRHDGKIRDQVFAADVPLHEASELLNNRLNRHDVTADIAGTPMTRQETRASLGLPIAKHLIIQDDMNRENLSYLQKQLLNLGFGEKLNDELEKQISKQPADFVLNTSNEFNQKKIDYQLHFKAGETEGMYFFNKYDATLQKGKDENIKQAFYLNKGNGITAKEAFNLMEGRAVHKQLYNKENEKYSAWLQLDPNNLTQNGSKEIKRFNENYGFDIEQTLTGKGIKEMEKPDTKESLLKSLKRGNAQQITVKKGSEETKYFIAASPQYKTVDLYDHQMKKIKREELLQPAQKQDTKQKQTRQQKEGLPAKKQRSQKNSIKV